MLIQSKSARAFLNEELARRLRSNPRYSQRAFARQLKLSPGELSEVLRGKRNLSLKSALKIAAALGLNSTETKHLLHLAQLSKAQELPGSDLLLPVAIQHHDQPLTLDLFRIVSDWQCFAILNLMDCHDFRANAQWIAKRLAIAPADARIAWERLVRVGLVEKKNEKWIVTKDFVISPTGIPSEAIRSYHRQVLEKAIEALSTQSVEDRDVTGIGFAMDPRHLPSIKKDISEFQDRLIAQYSKGKRTEVYQLQIALFRLTTPVPSTTKARSNSNET